MVVTPGTLLDWLRRMLNEDPSGNADHYDDRNIIRKQALLGTHVEKRFSSLKFDSRHFRCVTPKAFPLHGDPIQTNQLFGGIMGMATDSDQIRTPFFFTLNIVMRNQKHKLHTKCNLVLRQQGVGSFAPSLARKQEEYLWAVDELERGTKFYRIIPIMWVYGSDEWLVNESVTRAKRVWEGQGYVMQEDVIPEFDIPVIAPIVAQMVFSTGKSIPSETEMTLIKAAVRWAWQQEGNDAGIDTVYEYLFNFDRYSSEGGEIKEAASRLAFNLADFRSDGSFGRFFNGKSSLDISNDEFVVLELEHLKSRKELFRVVTLQVINAVTQDLYLSDKSDQRLIVFDEAWQFLGESSTLKEVIEEGYRRARKYVYRLRRLHHADSQVHQEQQTQVLGDLHGYALRRRRGEAGR